MPQPKSIVVSKAAPGMFEIRGCTYPHKDLFKELGCEWQGSALCWMWRGEKLPTPLQQLADGIYGLEALKTGVLAVEAPTTPKTPETPIAPQPQQESTPKSEPSKPEVVMPTWETKNITIATEGGKRDVTADVYGTVAVHKAIAGTGRTITHLESGMIVAYFPYTWLKSERIYPLAEKLHAIDITQLWKDKQAGLNNLPIINEVKKAVSDFDSLVKVALEAHDTTDVSKPKFKAGDPIRHKTGGRRAIFVRYEGDKVICESTWKDNGKTKTELLTWDEDEIVLDDGPRQPTLEELKVGMEVTWLRCGAKGWGGTESIKATVLKLNPKTVRVAVKEKVDNEWMDVEANVKLENLRLTKAKAVSELEIPEEVIDGLAEVRRSARINMGDQIGVVKQMVALGWDDGAEWLTDHPDMYMEALNEMGKLEASS